MQANGRQYPEMIRIKGGIFDMGTAEIPAFPDLKPVQQIHVKDFYMAKTEVTVAQWKYFCQQTKKKMPDPPAWGWIDSHPIVNVSWQEVVVYTDWLSDQTGDFYRLPTEQEWEFAASQKGSVNDEMSLLDYAWFLANSREKSQPVGTKLPNSSGLYDLLGNVAEWCLNWYAPYPLKDSPVPATTSSTFFKVVRGGSWYNTNVYVNPYIRYKFMFTAKSDYIGFRVVKIAKE